MKKIIQIFSFLFLAIFVSIISVNAQTRQYKAEIPFDFKIGRKSYHSGSYVLEVKKASNGNPMMILKDKQGKNLHIMSGIADDTVKGDARLTFSKVQDQLVLTGLVTSETNLPLAKPKAGKLVAGNSQAGRPASETVLVTVN